MKKTIMAILLAATVMVFIPAFAFAASDEWGVVPSGDVETIMLNDVKDINPASKNDIATYKFVSDAGGDFVFVAEGDGAYRGIVFDNDGSSYSSGGDAFSIGFHADAGVTYYLQAGIYPDDSQAAVRPFKVKLIQSALDTAEVDAVTEYVYTGKEIKPIVTVTLDGKTLVEGKDYELQGLPKKVGPDCFFVVGLGDYPGSILVDCDVFPKKAAISKVTPKAKSMAVKMKTAVGKTGGNTYEVSYAESGSSSWKSVKTKSQSATIKKLKKGKTYQVRVRAFKKVDGRTYYGGWSSIKVSKKIK